MGVWIETLESGWGCRQRKVTPCMGVWIETRCLPHLPAHLRSHPVWVCGLKRRFCQQRRLWGHVTPCMGVWIETISLRVLQMCSKSHPVWVCGLKHYPLYSQERTHRSHPVWVCGLKPRSHSAGRNDVSSHPVWVCGLKQTQGGTMALAGFVTPCMGVWIETDNYHTLDL